MEGATTLASSPRLTMTSPAAFCFSSPPAAASPFSTLWPCNNNDNNHSMTFSVGQVRPREDDCDKGFCFTPSPSLFNTSSPASSSSPSSTFCFSLLNNDPHCITSSPKGTSSFHTPSFFSPSATSNPFLAASSSFCDNTQNFGGSGCWPSSTTSFGSYSTSCSNSNNNTLMDVMSPTKKPRPSGWGLSQKARQQQREEEEEEEEEEAGPSSTRNHPSSFPSSLTPFSSRKRGFMVEELQQQKTGGEEDNSRPGSSLFPNNASNNMQEEELQQEGKAHVRRKLIHKKPDAKDIPKARLVEIRFGSEEETVPAKILYKEPWGVQVMLLESKEHLGGGGGAIKGKRYWAKFSGANTPVANIPILEAMHEC